MNAPTLGKPYQRGEDGRWVAPIHFLGRRHLVYGKTRREAVAKQRETARRLEQGAPARDSRATLTSFAEGWFDTTLVASGRRPATQALYRGLLTTHVLPRLGRLPLASIRPQDVERLFLELQSTLAASSRRNVYAAFRALMDSAVRDQMLVSNPVAVIPRPKTEHTEAAHLTPEQLAAFLAIARQDRLAGLWLLLAGTGLRRGEALGLHWDDVNLDDGHLRVRRTLTRINGVGLVEAEPKTARSRRTVALSAPVVAALREHRHRQLVERMAAGHAWQGAPNVFVTEVGTPCDPRNVSAAFERLAKAAGLKASVHSLRHTAATTMLTAGLPVLAVAESLGHSSPVVTLEVYGHVLPASRREGAELLGAALAASAE